MSRSRHRIRPNPLLPFLPFLVVLLYNLLRTTIMAIRTNINYNKSFSKKRKTRRNYNLKRSKTGKGGRPRKSWAHSKLGKQSTNKKVKKILGISAMVVFVLMIIGTVSVLALVAQYSSELPNPDEPFVKDQEQTSIIYDRDGNELYQFFGDQNREIVQIEDVPLHVRWAFLAAEDVDFYDHKGIDQIAIIRCGIENLASQGVEGCGGSTITQQMIKNTVLTNERSYERKIKEIILSLRIEQEYTKDEILQLYLNEIGFGGNVYGIKTAARVYFGKDIKDLTLAEAALLAGLPQAPGTNSPLFASDLEYAREKSVERQEYVLGQMEAKIDKINNEVGDENFLTSEMIDDARSQELVYKRGNIDIKAPHFVFYVREELKAKGFNNGEPFTENDLRRGGLRITTTLNYDMQQVAEDVVDARVDANVAEFGVYNSALVAIDPNNGDVLTMVGSKNYDSDPFPEGCTLGVDCKFEPDVNVALSYRQPGSSLKPMSYYKGFEQGVITPASFLPDIPITFAGGYEPKNAGDTFYGVGGGSDARKMLLESRNIPAVQTVELIGVDSFLQTLEEFGYAPLDRSQFGPSAVLGARQVTLLEHTAGYGVFATGGMLYPTNPILKIEDQNGNVLYEKEKDSDTEGKRVADEGAAYLINDILGDKSFTDGPYAKKFVGDYNLAGKTGTTDSSEDGWYVGYDPNIVVGVWSGNNDHSGPATPSAYGAYTSLPTWYDFMNSQVWQYEVKQFHRPAGIVNATVCSDSGLIANDKCGATKSEIFIQSKLPPEDNWSEEYEVCKDQKDHLARDIDRSVGLAEKIVIRRLKMAKEEWQPYLDKALGASYTVPTQECTVDRNPSGDPNKPWIVITKPKSGAVASSGTLDVDLTAYSVYGISEVEIFIDSTKITTVTNLPYKKSISIPSGISDGTHSFVVNAQDNRNQVVSASVSIVIGSGVPSGVVSVTSHADGDSVSASDSVVGEWSGDVSIVDDVELVIVGSSTTRVTTGTIQPDGSFLASWPGGLSSGSYEVYFELFYNGSSTPIQSGHITLNQ